MTGYSDVHRSILQASMNHGLLQDEELHRIFGIVCEKLDLKDLNVTTVINEINAKISPYDQKITKYEYDLDSSSYYVFCSTAKTSISKMQHSYTENELEFFKELLSQLASSIDLNISPREALNLQTSSGTKLNKVRAEKLVETWCANGYFIRCENLIYLGPKSLIEFKDDLNRMQFDHLKKCGLCDDIAAWGVTCGSCQTAKYHKNCIEKFIARSKKCPTCNSKWTELDE